MYLDTKSQSEILKNEIKKKIKSDMKIALILASEDSASKKYVENKIKRLDEFGIGYDLYEFINPDYITLENLIKKLSEDKSVDGIMVELPLPPYIDSAKLLDNIPYYKDVDGLTSHNMINLLRNKNTILPCTVKAIKTILEYNKIDYKEKNIAIVGRSMIVGKPLQMFFTNNDSTCTLCHSKTKDLEKITSSSDIVVVAVGKKEFFDKKYFRKDAVIIDVGTNYYDGRVYGDVGDISTDFNKITPVPGGVGLFTVLCMIDNLIELKSIKKD